MKKIIAVTLAAVMALSLVACGNKTSTDTPAGDVPAPDYSRGLTEEGYFEGVELSEYVTLPADYLNMKVPEGNVTVNEEDWDVYLEQLVYEFGAKQDAPADTIVADGMNISIDFEGTVDGVPFVGGSAEGVDFIVGSQTYLPEIEAGVLGHKVGDEFEVSLVFPEGYPSATTEDGKTLELSNQTAVFKIKIGSIFTKGMTDEVVAEKFAGQKDLNGNDITTVDGLKADFFARGEKTNKEAYLNYKLAQVAEISEIPEKIIKNMVESELEIVKSSAAAVGFSSVEEFLKQNGFESVDKYKEYVMSMHEEMLRPQMVLLTVAAKNELVPDTSLCATVFGGEFDELVETFGKGYVNQNLLMYQALELITEGATIVEGAPAEEFYKTVNAPAVEGEDAESETEAASSEPTEPEVSEDAESADSEIASSEVASSEIAESESVESEKAESEAAESESASSDAVSSESAVEKDDAANSKTPADADSKKG